MGHRLQIVTDGWSPDDGTDYSVDEFYVRSTNRHDHSETLRIRLPKDVQAQLGEVVRAGVFDQYKTWSDLVRDALVHRLWYLQQLLQDDELGRFLHLEMSLARADRAKREVETAAQVIKSWEITLEAIHQAGDLELLGLQVAQVQVVVEGWRDPYRSRLQEVVDRYKAKLPTTEG